MLSLKPSVLLALAIFLTDTELTSQYNNSSCNMSILDSKIKEKYYAQKTSMIPLEYVARLAWDENLGKRLKALRGKMSRRELAEKLRGRGISCSHQGIQQIELGGWETVDLNLILAMCEEFGISVGQLIPLVRVEQPDNFTIST